MTRFLLLSLPLLLLLQAAFHFGAEALDWPRLARLSGAALLGRWVVESLGLAGLFLLVRERTGGRLVAGLATAWGAWIFRGPVLLLTVVGATGPAASTWWSWILLWLVLYMASGLALAALAPASSDEAAATAAAEDPETPTDPSPRTPLPTSPRPAPAGDPLTEAAPETGTREPAPAGDEPGQRVEEQANEPAAVRDDTRDDMRDQVSDREPRIDPRASDERTDP